MHKKNFLSIAVVISIFMLLGTYIYQMNYNKSFSSFITLACDAHKYEQESETGYLTVVYANTNNKYNLVVKVDDADLQNKLSTSQLENIIGISLDLTIPYKILKDQHVNINNFDPYPYLISGKFSDYLVLRDVFYE